MVVNRPVVEGLMNHRSARVSLLLAVFLASTGLLAARADSPPQISEQVKAAAASQGSVRAIVVLKDSLDNVHSSLALPSRPERIKPVQERVLKALKGSKVKVFHQYRN